MAAMPPQTRTALTAAALCAAPFCVGAALFSPAAGGGVHGPSLWPCPFRALTGAPCPMCGATRSVVLAAHGDPRFLHYNPWWVFVLVAGVVCGLAAAVATARGRPLPALRGRAPTAALVAALALGWAVALVNATAVTGG
jgi:hypothetical protein